MVGQLMTAMWVRVATAASTTTTTTAPPFSGLSVNPTSAGMPGEAFVSTLLNWLGAVALWGSLASLLIGAATWGLLQQMGNPIGASRGRTLALAGAIGAALAGLAPHIVTIIYRAANA